MIEIRIGQFPGEVKSYIVAEGTTVGEAIKFAGVDVVLRTGDNMQIKLDGNVVDENSVLNSYSKLLLISKNLKGAK